ncbi:hypothetical protein HN51_054062 [Arachis hypogaea]
MTSASSIIMVRVETLPTTSTTFICQTMAILKLIICFIGFPIFHLCSIRTSLALNLQEETNLLQLVTLLPSLSELYLEYCGLRDIYPSLQYANFTAFDILDLSNKYFVPAKLPTWIFNFSSGEIPNCWIRWKSSKYINLEGNNFRGQIPYSISILSNLVSFSLFNNRLSGEVPVSLKICEKLQILNLGENKFSGAISNWVGQNITALQLRSNLSNGNIPTTICKLDFLKILDLSNNKLLGPIPSCCGVSLFASRNVEAMCNPKVLPCDEKDKNTLIIGVQCDNTTGKDTGLSLTCPQIYPVYGNDINKLHCLTGELNISSLFELQFLSFLELGNNNFSNIHYHGQGGNSSNNLHYLDFSDNGNHKADHMLHWISNLSSLQYQDLTGINLQEETNWLQLVTLLPSISELYLEYYGLRKIYPSLQYANFTALDVLDLSNNDFIPAKLPTWIFNFSFGISTIFLSKTSLQCQLPQTFPHFQSLDSLFLDDNDLNGSTPNWVGPFPTSLKNLSSLTCLSLESISGNIFENFFHTFSNLEHLGFGSQSLLFDFDPQWIPHFQLQTLILDVVRPKLPSRKYRQGSLPLLNILNSRIPLEPSEKFWKFISDQVEYLVFQTSSINGKVMCLEYPQMSLFWIYPTTLCLDPFVIYYVARQKKKNHLNSFDLSQNLLSGEIPNCWIHWKSSKYINLEGNNFRGQIPYSISILSNLVSFSLFNYRLSGEVPVSLKICEKLRILNLGENKFSGAILNWVGQNITPLQLRSNLSSSNIPTTICKLDFLKLLDLSNNKLSRPIPSCCGVSLFTSRNVESFLSSPSSSIHCSQDVAEVLLSHKAQRRQCTPFSEIDLS